MINVHKFTTAFAYNKYDEYIYKPHMYMKKRNFIYHLKSDLIDETYLSINRTAFLSGQLIKCGMVTLGKIATRILTQEGFDKNINVFLAIMSIGDDIYLGKSTISNIHPNIKYCYVLVHN